MHSVAFEDMLFDPRVTGAATSPPAHDDDMAFPQVVHRSQEGTNDRGVSQLFGNQGLTEAAIAKEKQRQLIAQQFKASDQRQTYPGGTAMNPLLGLETLAANQMLINNLLFKTNAMNNQFSLSNLGKFNHSALAAGAGADIFTANTGMLAQNANIGLSVFPPRPEAVYRDASVMPDPVVFNRNGIEKSGRSAGSSEPFPQKLHRMLSELVKQADGSDMASFLPHGRAFAIHNPKQFASEIMHKYFRMSRFSSFQRQLNLYDFKRISEGRDKGAYYHELFLQGRTPLCTQMKRAKIKGQTGGGYHEELNFYLTPPVQRAKALVALPVAPTIESSK